MFRVQDTPQEQTSQYCVQVRPTKMMYTELYELNNIISFVAEFIQYEPLENPLHMPEHLISPMSTLAFQAGDTIDMATLLVSMLTGVGYDAYVVMGYAPPDIVMNDQSLATCPLLEAEQRQQAAEAVERGRSQTTKPSKYPCAALALCTTCYLLAHVDHADWVLPAFGFVHISMPGFAVVQAAEGSA